MIVSDRKKTGLILSIASVLMLSPFILNLIRTKNPLFQNMGFTIEAALHPIPWILSALLSAFYILCTFKNVPFVLKMQREISLLKLIGVISAFAGGLLEEVIFRRWLMDLISNWGQGEVTQIFVSGTVFGLAHSVWFLFRRDLKFILPAILSTTVLGFGLAVIYLTGGRNVGPCIAGHVIINLVVEPWLLLSSVSGIQKSA